METTLIRIAVPLSLIVLTACGSSPKPQDTPPPDEETESTNLPEDPRWTSVTFGVPACDRYFQHMAKCREALPAEVRGALDSGMNAVADAWMESKEKVDMAAACSEVDAAAKESFAEMCPAAFED